MPIKRTTIKGKPALKWGEEGKPYPYKAGSKSSLESAKKKVMKQAAAVEISTGAWKAKKR